MRSEEYNALSAKLDKLMEYIESREPKRIRFGEWIERWYGAYKAPNCKPATLGIYRAYMSHAAESFGNMNMSEITPLDLQEYLAAIHAGNTRRKVYVMLGSVFKKAFQMEYLDRNPMLYVDVKRYISVKRRAYTYAEQDAMINKLPVKYKPLFVFLCCTGLRIGEMLALTPGDVDTGNNNILVTKSANLRDKSIVDTPKTESSKRNVMFVPELIEYVEKYIPLRRFLQIYTYSGAKKAFQTAVARLRLRGMLIHSTRHTFASICNQLGINDKVTQNLLGHSSAVMTKDTYTHMIKRGNNEILRIMEKLKERIEREY